jgi:hypothetical protein
MCRMAIMSSVFVVYDDEWIFEIDEHPKEN